MNETIDVFSWQKVADKNKVSFQYPNEQKQNQWQLHGFLEENHHAADALGWWGLRLQTGQQVDSQWTVIELHCSLKRNPAPETIITIQTKVFLEPNKEVLIPFNDFDFEQGMQILFKAIVGVTIHQTCELTELTLISHPVLKINAPIKGKPLKESLQYEFTLTNTTSSRLPVHLFLEKRGWEVLPVTLNQAGKCIGEETFILLEPHETSTFSLSVATSPRFATLGREQQRVVAEAEGYQVGCYFETVNASTDFLTTLSCQDIAEIKEKLQQADWAKEKFDQLYQQACDWQVPKIDPTKPYLFLTRQSDEAGNAALIYLLTEEITFAEKTAEFLKEFIREDHGYLTLPHAGNQELVHEGEFFKHTALAYDRIKHLQLLTKAEEERLEEAFRLFMQIIADECCKGRVSNWNLAELSGAITCAAVLQDLERIDFFIENSNGVKAHIARGILDDGWWYEASIGYNLLAMGLFLEICQTVDKWGYNLKSERIPVNFATYYNLDEHKMPAEERIDGLISEVWGPSKQNTRSIEMLVDSMLAFYDSTGVIFGMNDSGESRAVGVHLLDPRFDLAYRIYPKSKMLPLLHTIEPTDRDLLFGLAKLPEYSAEDEDFYQKTIKADVAGITLLRSQDSQRNVDERYQVGIKTGILGGAHGHYDRLALNSIRRYGKNFYNPENIWYAYHTFMYKFFVQNSITHNMTVVDLKQQDPREAVTKEFYSDDHLQYVLQETRTQWCNPPYGGWRVGENETFAERCWKEGRYVPIPSNPPEYTKRTDFTEEILQRRGTLVTDDYVVICDYLAGNQKHDFDCLFHISGLQGIYQPEATKSYRLTNDLTDSCSFSISESEKLHYDHFSEKLDDSPLSSGQFVTECHWFKARDQVRLDFSVDMAKYNDQGWLTKLRTAENAPGLLNMSLYTVDPEPKEIVIACDPEYYQTQQQLHYQIQLDQQTVYENRLGTWVLGRDEIDLKLTSGNELCLITETNYVANEYGDDVDVPLPAIFWGDGYLITKTGEKLFLQDLAYQIENIQPVPVENRDYYGGPVKIQTKLMTSNLPATPENANEKACITFDISGLELEKLVVTIGGDYPLGDEFDRRRLVSFRKRGTEARFLSVLEQYDQTPVIQQIEATATGLKVFLIDGSVDEIVIPDPTLAKGEFQLIKGQRGS